MTQTAAAARLRALSTALPTTQAADWYPQVPGMRDLSAIASLTHNSITANLRPMGVPTAPAGGAGFGAAKQGAPPRGVPR